MKRNLFFGALVASGMVFGATGAQAAFELQNWRFDAGGIDGLANDAAYNSESVDSWTFNAFFLQQLVNDTGPAGFSIGDQGTVDGRGVITAINDASVGIISPPQLNQTVQINGLDGYEITFDFAVDYQITDVDAQDVNFTHIAATNANGLLNIYIDNLGDASKCNAATGSGCTDGTLVGTFQVVPGGGGNFNASTISGTDDATFEAIFLEDGVWYNEDGIDLACNDAVVGEECNGNPLGMTDSNIDSDPDGNGNLDTTSTEFVEECGVGVEQSPFSSCGFEDGSFVLAAVPEPGTLAVFSLGLVALGGFAGLRRHKKS